MRTDEEKYKALMAKYKEARLKPGTEPLRYLQAAMEIQKRGNVSKDVILGCAYL